MSQTLDAQNSKGDGGKIAFLGLAIAAGSIKFIIGGLLVIAAVFYLIFSSYRANAQYFQILAVQDRVGMQFVVFISTRHLCECC